MYDAYGSLVWGGNDVFAFGGKFGYYTDTETGLVLCTYRYYDPNTGRWINRDPIGYAGGLNTYAYVQGNPVNAVDPSGLDVGWARRSTVPWGDPYGEWAQAVRIGNRWFASESDFIMFWMGGGDRPQCGIGSYEWTLATDAVEDGAEAGMKMAAGVGRTGRNPSRYTDHAEERKAQGRNVGRAITALQAAKASQIYAQDDGRFVVRGGNAQEFIFEPDGRVLTALSDRSQATVTARLKSGRIRSATDDEVLTLKAFHK